MKHCLLFIVCFMFTGAELQSQAGSATNTGGDILTRLMDDQVEGQVSIVVDSLLVANYYKFITQNKKVQGVPGFRILIYSESGIGAKEEQQRTRARFLSLYPGTDAYYRYDEPFFKVYVGDCRTRSEALKLIDRIKRNYPNSFHIPNDINILTVE